MSGRKSGKTFPSKLDNFSSHWDLHLRQNVKWSREEDSKQISRALVIVTRKLVGNTILAVEEMKSGYHP